MAITGQQVIGVGLQNESANSDSLYTAFTKTKNNFATLFACASPYVTFTGTGISALATPGNGTVDLTNTGVTSVIAGTGIVIDTSTGNVTISSTGGNGAGGTVTSVGLLSSTLTVSALPIVSSGALNVNLPAIANVAGTYSHPSMTVDVYGRISAITSAPSSGTVTSVAVSAGTGIQVTGSPITSSGTINIINTGVTRITSGTGISVTGTTGNISISSTVSGTVTSVGVTSNSLTVSTTPITSSGSLSIEIPSGSEDLPNLGAANLSLSVSYFSTAAAETATLAAGTVTGGTKDFIMVADSGDMVITVANAGWKTSGAGTATFDTIGDSCRLRWITSKWFCIGNNGVVFA